MQQKESKATSHFIMSLIKSGIRIAGYSFLFIDITVAVWVLIFSESFGILEEII